MYYHKMTSDVINISKFRKLSENQKLLNSAKAMYFSDKMFPTEIAEKLNIDINELGEYVFGKDRTGKSKHCWYYLKEQGKEPEFIHHYEEIKTIYIKSTEKKLMKAIDESIESLLKDKSKMLDMEPKDILNLIAAYEKMDKIGRLEEDKPTSHSISERKTFSLREIVEERKAKDAEVVDAKFKELE